MCCGEYIQIQMQKQQQEPDTSLDGQMAKMASELFAVAVAYVPRLVANVTAATLHYLQTFVVFRRLGITQILAAKQTLILFLPSHVDVV